MLFWLYINLKKVVLFILTKPIKFRNGIPIC